MGLLQRLLLGVSIETAKKEIHAANGLLRGSLPSFPQGARQTPLPKAQSVDVPTGLNVLRQGGPNALQLPGENGLGFRV